MISLTFPGKVWYGPDVHQPTKGHLVPKRLSIPLLAAVLVGGVLGITHPAQADTTDVTLTTTVKNHADNGHGSPSHWADDTFVRTTTIHHESGDTYTVTLTGTGTFKTVKGAGSPNGSGDKVARTAKGVFTEWLTATVHGSLKGKVALHNLDGTIYNDKRKTHKTTGQWLVAPFKKNAQAATTAYSYTYQSSACSAEKWTDASTNNDGQGAAAGNVTGKKCTPFVLSVLTAKAKCRVSKADKREIWTVTNVSGGRDRQFWAWVWSPNPHAGQRKDGWFHLPNGHGSYTVKAGKSLDIVSGWGGVLSVKYYDGKGDLKALRASSNHKITCK